LIEIVEMCQGGPAGTDLIRLPYDNLPLLENPNLFFQAREIINREKLRFYREKAKENKPGADGDIKTSQRARVT